MTRQDDAPRVFGSPSTSASPRYVVVNGLRYAVPYLHEFIVKVSEKREGGTLASALSAHVKYQGQISDGGKDFWAGILLLIHDENGGTMRNDISSSAR